MTRLAVLVASLGCIGHVPIAPGTAGSAAALLLYLLVRWSGSPLVEGAVLITIALVGTWSASVSQRYLGASDPAQVVIDEVLGMLMTLAFMQLRWRGVIVAFLVFRALDIVKPFPANVAERLHGGLGVMADDAMSGVYGNIVMRLLLWLAPAWM